MKIKVKGILADQNGKALRSKMIRACIYNSRGALTPIASGKTVANGSFILKPTTTFADTALPRVALQIQHKNKWLMLCDQPRSFTLNTADFSKILFHEKQLYKIGAIPFHGDNRTVSLSTPVIVRSIEQPIAVAAPGTTARTATVNVASIDTLNTKVTALEKAKIDLTRERDTAKAELKKKDNLVKTKDQQIKKIRDDLTKQHSQQISLKEARIKQLETENAQLKKTTTKPTEITALNAKVGTLEKAKIDLLRERDTAKTDLQNKINLLKAKDKEIIRVRTDLTKQHAKEIASKEAAIKQLQEQNKELNKGTPERVNIDDIAFSTGSQIEDAQRRLSESKSSIRLSKVSLQMKGIADPTGRAMTLPATKDISALAPGMSVLNMDFIPRVKAPETKAPTKEIKIPSYLGLTEAKLRRELDGEEIPYTIYHQPLKPGDTANLGRVIHQSPAAGATAEPDTQLRIIVGTARG